MPRGPRGEKRPADVIGNAVHVMRIATGEIDESAPSPDDGKDPAAVALGRKGGKKNVTRAKRKPKLGSISISEAAIWRRLGR